jgi:hypothetical protein
MMTVAGGQCSSAKKNTSESSRQRWFIASADGGNSFNMQYTIMLTSLTVAVSKSALGALNQGDRLCVTLPKKGRCMWFNYANL